MILSQYDRFENSFLCAVYTLIEVDRRSADEYSVLHNNTLNFSCSKYDYSILFISMVEEEIFAIPEKTY